MYRGWPKRCGQGMEGGLYTISTGDGDDGRLGVFVFCTSCTAIAIVKMCWTKRNSQRLMAESPVVERQLMSSSELLA